MCLYQLLAWLASPYTQLGGGRRETKPEYLTDEGYHSHTPLFLCACFPSSSKFFFVVSASDSLISQSFLNIGQPMSRANDQYVTQDTHSFKYFELSLFQTYLFFPCEHWLKSPQSPPKELEQQSQFLCLLYTEHIWFKISRWMRLKSTI